jgi:predicted nucleic-acid-binding protein
VGRRALKITPDTNVLVRVIVHDNPEQMRAAQAALAGAEAVFVTIPALCEVAWVLRYRYRLSPAKVGLAVRKLIGARNVTMDRPAAEAGLKMLESGGDFADGVIAWQGAADGAETFVSFDKKAVKTLTDLGEQAQLLT